MKNYLSKKSLHAVYAVVAFILASVMLLWSWNTLSVLFDGPAGQFKHAVAALAIAYIFGWVTRRDPRRGRHPLLEGPKGSISE